MMRMFPKNLPDAYILAGGESKRFPGDKALTTIHGQPQIVRLREQMLQAGHRVTFVADRTDRYSAHGITCIVDQEPRSGPLGGLITVLSDQIEKNSAGWTLVLGCDQLTWRAQWSFNQRSLYVAKTVEYDDTQDTSSSNAMVLIWKESIFSPIPGYYHTNALPHLKQLWRTGERSLKAMQNCSKLVVSEFPNTGEHPSSYSFNSPDKLAELLTKLDLYS